MSYLDAQELAVPTAPPYEVGRFGMYEIPDATAIARAWRAGRRPEGSVSGPWLRGDRALFWWRDPLPAVAAVAGLVGRRVRPRDAADAANPALVTR